MARRPRPRLRLAHVPRRSRATGPAPRCAPTGTTLANEHVRVEVDPADGTLTIEADGVHAAPGANRYVDGGDGGDTYNYSPARGRHRSSTDPTSVRVARRGVGPGAARLVVTATYRWPTARDRRRTVVRTRAATTPSPSRSCTTLELRTGERFLRVRVELDHHVRDHRLRAHFPLPRRVDGSDAECAFAVVHRGLTAEGGPHEFGLPTFVSRRFVDCRATATSGSRCCTTASSSTRWSTTAASSRSRCCAPPATSRAPSCRCARTRRPARPARGPAAPGPPGARVRGAPPPRRLARRGASPPPPTSSSCRSSGSAAAAGRVPTSRRPVRRCAVDGAEVSALQPRRHGRARSVRVVNLSPELPTEVTLATRDGVPLAGDVVDLTGSVLEAFTGSAPLRPWQLLTVRCDRAPDDHRADGAARAAPHPALARRPGGIEPGRA